MTCDNCKHSNAQIMVACTFLCYCDYDGEYHNKSYSCEKDDPKK